MAILEVKNLRKIYTTRFGGNKVEALSNVNFSVAEGEFVAIMGESGSGNLDFDRRALVKQGPDAVPAWRNRTLPPFCSVTWHITQFFNNLKIFTIPS